MRARDLLGLSLTLLLLLLTANLTGEAAPDLTGDATPDLAGDTGPDLAGETPPDSAGVGKAGDTDPEAGPGARALLNADIAGESALSREDVVPPEGDAAPENAGVGTPEKPGMGESAGEECAGVEGVGSASASGEGSGLGFGVSGLAAPTFSCGPAVEAGAGVGLVFVLALEAVFLLLPAGFCGVCGWVGGGVWV